MDWHVVKTQEEFDAAIEARKPCIELAAEIVVDIRIPMGFVPSVKSIAGALIRLFAGSVVARGSSRVVALESSSVEALESSSVEAWESSSVVARGSSSVVARESSSVVARESSRVVAWESSSVVARGSSRVEALESSSVEALESSSVEAWESSSVVARGSSRVEARESSSVEAWAAAALSLFGGLVKAKATALVSVHLHRGASCDGGVQIPVPVPSTPREWCEWYGAKIDGDDAIVFKGVGDDFCSPHGTAYTPGTETVADDWDGGKQECGKGLHFSPTPAATLKFNSSATKFVACRVPLSALAVHPNGEYPDKVKAESCWNWYECDRFGDQIGERFEKPEVVVK